MERIARLNQEEPWIFCFMLIFLVLPCSMWDLSSLTRDLTCTPNTGRWHLNLQGPPGKSKKNLVKECLLQSKGSRKSMKDFKQGREEVNFAFQKSGCNDYINNMTEREDRIQGVERKKSWEAIITQTRGDSGLDCSGIREKWIDSISINPQGFPWWHSSKEPICQCRRPGFNPWIRKIPRRRKWEPTPEFLPGKSHEQRSPSGSSPWGHKELDTT